MEENRNQESIYDKTLEKGKEKERSKKDLEKIVFTTGCLREPVINSHTQIFISTFRDDGTSGKS